jgi:RNA polymerase sigma-70 factor (ECF subfamily)
MEDFESYRPMMFGIAYRMLGSAMEAEDMVQEAYLRYQATPPDSIRNLKSFLGTVITRLCLDQLKSARAQRETYIGPWLPEPVLTGAPHMEVNRLIEYESISMAFLVLLESLTPVERAVFLLREVFDYEYAEIADIVDKEEAACRQLFSRAKKHIAEHRPRFKSTPEEQREMISRFWQAVVAGEMEGLMNLLAEDITWWSDGGGKVSAARRPLHGRDEVARFVLGIARQAPPDLSIDVAEVNGQQAVIMRIAGKVYYVWMFDMHGGLIREVHAVGNPDKLKHVE